MIKHLLTIALVMLLGVVSGQTQSNLPPGSTPYSGNLFLSPDGLIWTGKAGSYTNLGSKENYEALVAAGYTNAQIDSIALDTYNRARARVNHTGTQAISTIAGLQSVLDSKIQLSEKGSPLGVATLDANSKVPLVQMPDALIGSVNYQGNWNALTNTPTLPTTPTSITKGHYYIVSTAGTFNGVEYNNGDWIISNGLVWGKVDNNNKVASVNGKVGAVSLNLQDVTTVGATSTVDITAPTFIGNLTGTASQLSTPDFTNTSNIDFPLLTGVNGNVSVVSRLQGKVTFNGATGLITVANGLNIGGGSGAIHVQNIPILGKNNTAGNLYVAAPASTGNVIIRPRSLSDGTSQSTFSSDGMLTVGNHVNIAAANGEYRLSGTGVMSTLGSANLFIAPPSATGEVYIRPQGITSNTGIIAIRNSGAIETSSNITIPVGSFYRIGAQNVVGRNGANTQLISNGAMELVPDPAGTVFVGGAITQVTNLAGTGIRMVVANSSGQLSTQALPGINPSSYSYVNAGSATVVTLGGAAVSFNGHDLAGGITNTGSVLNVPIAGRYKISYKLSGTLMGAVTNLMVNGVIHTRANTTRDGANHSTTVLTLPAAATVSLQISNAIGAYNHIDTSYLIIEKL